MTCVEDQFPVVPVARLEADTKEARWLIEHLWSASAVGLIGGQPKCFKSWLALEMAVSVASGRPCLGRFPVHDPGPALVYLAEDSLPAVRERIAALATQREVDFESLDVRVITAPSMRVDLARDQVRLQKTVRQHRPRLLVLDPLVRIHRLDENSSAEVSGFLAYLRALERELDVAIVLVHHTRKNAGSGHAAGQGLRGSGDFHAWSDSALYLRRVRDGNVVVTVEHRSASAPDPFAIRLMIDPRVHLAVVDRGVLDRGQEPNDSLEDRIVNALKESSPINRSELRQRLGVKNERLGHALERLEARERIGRTAQGWALGNRVPRSPPIEMKGTERFQEFPGEAEAGSAGEQPAEE